MCEVLRLPVMVRVTGIILCVCVCGKDVFDRVRKEERGHALRTWGGLYNLVDFAFCDIT
jgi:hypothetical protein